jgi:UDPglucose 6-dehydrogenase
MGIGEKNMKVMVAGLFHLGCVTAGCLANAGHDVIAYDPDKKLIQDLQAGKLPIFEPGLDDVVKRARGRNLFFSTDIVKGIQEADIIFVSVNTPTKTFGHGAGKASDLQYWEKTARQILDVCDSGKIIVEKLTSYGVKQHIMKLFLMN